MAKGSAGELKTQVIIAEESDTSSREVPIELRQRVLQLSAMIGALIKTLKSRQMSAKSGKSAKGERGRTRREERGSSSLAFRAFLARPAFPAYSVF